MSIFADLYSGSPKGQPTVPARVVASVMVLQAFEGLSDQEAGDRLEADLRWQAAAGSMPGTGRSTRRCWWACVTGCASARPRRLFGDTKVVGRQAGAMKGRARVLDATAVYDAVPTQDTVTQLRAAIRKLLGCLD
jgi:hypothetical protein